MSENIDVIATNAPSAPDLKQDAQHPAQEHGQPQQTPEDARRSEQYALLERLLRSPAAPGQGDDTNDQGENRSGRSEAGQDQDDGQEPDRKEARKNEDDRLRDRNGRYARQGGRDDERDGRERDGGHRIVSEPPRFLSYGNRSQWGTVPEEMQRELSTRFEEADKHIGKLHSNLETWRPMADLIDKWSDRFAETGAHPVQAIENALDLAHLADTDPIGIIKTIAGHWKLDLFRIADGSAEHDTALPDPKIARLERQLSEVNRVLKERNVREKDAVRQSEQSALADMKNVIEATREDMPFMDQIVQDMIPFVQSLRNANPKADPRETLIEAHDRAVWAHPKLRSYLIDELAKARSQGSDQQAGDQGTNPKSQTQAPHKSPRRANVINVRSAATPTTPPRSRKDEVSAILSKHGIR